MTHLNQLAEKYIWLRIDTVPAKKISSTAEMPHLILQKPEWWKEKVNEHSIGDIVHENLQEGKIRCCN